MIKVPIPVAHANFGIYLNLDGEGKTPFSIPEPRLEEKENGNGGEPEVQAPWHNATPQPYRDSAKSSAARGSSSFLPRGHFLYVV